MPAERSFSILPTNRKALAPDVTCRSNSTQEAQPYAGNRWSVDCNLLAVRCDLCAGNVQPDILATRHQRRNADLRCAVRLHLFTICCADVCAATDIASPVCRTADRPL